MSVELLREARNYVLTYKHRAETPGAAGQAEKLIARIDSHLAQPEAITVDGYPDMRVWCRNCEAATEHEVQGRELICKSCASIACTFHPKECTAEQVRAWLKEKSDRREQPEAAPVADWRNRYYVQQQGFWWWVVKCGTGVRALFKARSPEACEEMAQELTTAFNDGLYIATPVPLQAEQCSHKDAKGVLTIVGGYEDGWDLTWCDQCGVITWCSDSPTIPDWETGKKARSAWCEKRVLAWGCSTETKGREKCNVWCGQSYCPVAFKDTAPPASPLQAELAEELERLRRDERDMYLNTVQVHGSLLDRIIASLRPA